MYESDTSPHTQSGPIARWAIAFHDSQDRPGRVVGATVLLMVVLSYFVPGGVFAELATLAGISITLLVSPMIFVPAGAILGFCTAVQDARLTNENRLMSTIGYSIYGAFAGGTLSGLCMFLYFPAVIVVGLLWRLVGLIV